MPAYTLADRIATEAASHAEAWRIKSLSANLYTSLAAYSSSGLETHNQTRLDLGVVVQFARQRLLLRKVSS